MGPFDIFFKERDMGGESVDATGFDVHFDGAIAQRLHQQARINRESVSVVVARAVREFVARQSAIPPLPSPAKLRKIAAKAKRTDAKDDWQDYVDWPE